MSWTLAPCLVTLRNQINAAAPNRSKAVDGTIGDAAHAASKSDHNPDASGIVRAFDITHDPAGGLDAGALADAIVASRDNRVKYLIYNRRVIGQQYWTWTPYDGADPHTSHLHVSVVADGRANSTTPWQIASGITPQEDIMNAAQERKLDQLGADVDYVQKQVKATAELIIEMNRREVARDAAYANSLQQAIQSGGAIDAAAVRAAVETALAGIDVKLSVEGK